MQNKTRLQEPAKGKQITRQAAGEIEPNPCRQVTYEDEDEEEDDDPTWGGSVKSQQEWKKRRKKAEVQSELPKVCIKSVCANVTLWTQMTTMGHISKCQKERDR